MQRNPPIAINARTACGIRRQRQAAARRRGRDSLYSYPLLNRGCPLQSIEPRRDRDNNRQTSRLASRPTGMYAPRTDRLRRRNRLLAILLVSVAALGFAVVILLAVLLRYGRIHLIAGL